MESILDTPYQKIRFATKFQVYVYDYILFESIRLSVKLCDDSGQVVDTKLFLLENDDYNNWETISKGSDQYIIDWVKRQLNSET